MICLIENLKNISTSIPKENVRYEENLNESIAFMENKKTSIPPIYAFSGHWNKHLKESGSFVNFENSDPALFQPNEEIQEKNDVIFFSCFNNFIHVRFILTQLIS